MIDEPLTGTPPSRRNSPCPKWHHWPLLLALASCSVSTPEDREGIAGRSAARPAQQVAAAAPAGPRAPLARLLSVPRRAGFEENRGQWPDGVAYVARDGAATLFLAATEAVWRLRPRDDGAAAGHASGDYVRMRWLGADPAAQIVATQPQPARVNYAHGNDPSAWRTGIPLYGRITYRNLYPGIDLVFHGERGALEYDLVVAPGADPSRIRLALEGPLTVVRDRVGALTLETSTGDVIHRRPVAYQDDEDRHRDVAARYRVHAGGTSGASTEIGFALGTYDRSRAVVIDPRIAYQTKIDSATDTVIDAAADANGNLWVVGSTASPDFPTTDDAIQPAQRRLTTATSSSSTRRDSSSTPRTSAAAICIAWAAWRSTRTATSSSAARPRRTISPSPATPPRAPMRAAKVMGS